MRGNNRKTHVFADFRELDDVGCGNVTENVGRAWKK